VESERPPQILLEISPRRLAGAARCYAWPRHSLSPTCSPHSATALAHQDVGHEVVGAAPCQCHSPPGADDLAEQIRKRESRVVLMERISGERHPQANVARFGQQCALRKPAASRVDR
jgi:hypothetical protein